MTSNKGGGAAGDNNLDDLPEPDYDHLSFSYMEEEEEEHEGDNAGNDKNGYPKKPHKKKGQQQQQHVASSQSQTPSETPYILGTLIVRVVAAQDLQSDDRNGSGGGGIGDFFFGGGGKKGHNSNRNNRNNGGTTNPYASVKFGSSTQRTSDLFDTLDPVWPRGETMFMDVSLDMSKTSHPDPTALRLMMLMKDDDDDDDGSNDNDEENCNSGSTNKVSNINKSIKKKDPPRVDNTKSSSDDPESTQQPTPPSSRSEKNDNNKIHMDSTESLDIPQPFLTIAVFSASEVGKANKSLLYEKPSTTKQKHDARYPNKKKSNAATSGDSDDAFLGMASIDLTTLLTGKQGIVDAWVPLTGSNSGSVRIVCEYETTDVAPTKGDLVKFTRFCHPADLYPLVPGRTYPVQDVVDQDHVILSYTSPEGWVCSFVIHRFMVLCTERHHGAAEACREEWQSITEKLAYSPLVGSVADTVHRLPEEGLFAVGATVIQGSAGLLGRWLEGGLETAVKDVAFVTNWDGRFNPGSQQQRPSTTDPLDLAEENISSNDTTESNINDTVQSQSESRPATLKKAPPPSSLPPTTDSSSNKEPLPNMPSCPITSEPMIDPVVAADGHTYERAAIARWLQESDKSPLTGSILPHKELVPNYGLLSSLQEQADARRRFKPPPPVTANIAVATVPHPDVDSPLFHAEEKTVEFEKKDAVVVDEDVAGGNNDDTDDDAGKENEAEDTVNSDDDNSGQKETPKSGETTEAENAKGDD